MHNSVHTWQGRLLLRAIPLLLYLLPANAVAWQRGDASPDLRGSAEPCDFHALCSCDRDRSKAYCRGVPLTTLPETRGYSHVTIEGCTSLSVLKNASSLRPSDVASLQLNDNRLHRVERGAFASVPNLTNLDLSRNRLTQFPVGALLSLTRLQRLDLRSNSIGELDAAEVRLNLTGNLLEQVPGTALDQIRNLSYLLLGDNAVQRLDPNWTLATEHLDTLNLARNVISQLPPRMFQRKKRVTVRHFILADNYLHYLPSEPVQDDWTTSSFTWTWRTTRSANFPAPSRSYRRLQKLNLRDNQISELGEYDLFSCRVSLRELDISSNHFDAVPHVALKFLSRLKTLNMADNSLTSVETRDFKHGLDGLLSLDLSGNRISYIEQHAFATLSKLANLRLAYNPITTINFDWFPKGCPNLKAIDVSGTRLESDTVNSFLQSCQRINSLDATYARAT
ncbi:hypothetical protein MTO96_033409 [Rhipicephalus appendiculatus]